MAQSGVCSEVGIKFGIMAPNPTIQQSPFPNFTIVESYLPKNVVFHQRLSSIEGHLPSRVVFHWRSSSIEDRLQSKVVFLWRSSFDKRNKRNEILMAADPPRQASEMVYLHWKRLNFIQKGQNESRYPQVDIKTGIFAWENTKKVGLFFLFWMVSEGYF